MHTLGRALVALVAVTLSGCVKLDSYSCAQSSECQNGELLGTCEPGGLCSFPDALCPSGKKFGDLAGDQSGQCVGDGTGTSSDPTTTFNPTTSVSGGTTFDPTSSPTSSPTTDSISTTFEMTSTSEVSATTTTDPTNTSLTTDGTTTDPGTTTGPTCGALNEACVDGTCCGSCSVCESGICLPANAEQALTFCGSQCSMCGGDGNCAPVPAETPCMSDCSEIVWQVEVVPPKTTCFAFAPFPVQSVCDGVGSCTLPAPEICPDPLMVPGSAVPLASCDSVCVQAPDLCMPGKPANQVEPGSYCALNFGTPQCQTTCSADQLTLEQATCNGEGVCVQSEIVNCNPYVCDLEKKACPTKCTSDNDCVSMNCQGQKCN